MRSQPIPSPKISKCCHVLSGVPQCSAHCYFKFISTVSIIIIPLSDSMTLTLYADDLLIYKPILTESSQVQLQGDINSISLWADNNLMTFNASKCKCMLLTNRKTLCFQLQLEIIILLK